MTARTGWPQEGRPASCSRSTVTPAPESTRLSLRFTLVNQLGNAIATFSSDELGPGDVEAAASGGEFTCDVPALPLVPGRYRIDVEVHGRAYLQDAIEGAVFFEVEQGVLGGDGPSRGTRAATSWSTIAGRRPRSTNLVPLFPGQPRAQRIALSVQLRAGVPWARSRLDRSCWTNETSAWEPDSDRARASATVNSFAAGWLAARSIKGLGQPDGEPDELDRRSSADLSCGSQRLLIDERFRLCEGIRTPCRSRTPGRLSRRAPRRPLPFQLGHRALLRVSCG